MLLAANRAHVTREQLLEKIVAAKADIVAAELALQTVMRALTVAKRAEKTTISEATQDAFAKLRAALAHLVELEALLLATAAPV